MLPSGAISVVVKRVLERKQSAPRGCNGKPTKRRSFNVIVKNPGSNCAKLRTCCSDSPHLLKEAQDGNTPLHLACKIGAEATVKLLQDPNDPSSTNIVNKVGIDWS